MTKCLASQLYLAGSAAGPLPDCGYGRATAYGRAMATAMFNGQVIAESDETIVVEGNHYFPPASVNHEFFTEHERTSVCGWKGTANYYSVSVQGETADAAAWYYAEPLEKATNITNYVAFYPAVTVTA